MDAHEVKETARTGFEVCPECTLYAKPVEEKRCEICEDRRDKARYDRPTVDLRGRDE